MQELKKPAQFNCTAKSILMGGDLPVMWKCVTNSCDNDYDNKAFYTSRTLILLHCMWNFVINDFVVPVILINLQGVGTWVLID